MWLHCPYPLLMALARFATSLGSKEEHTRLVDNHGIKSAFTLPITDFVNGIGSLYWCAREAFCLLSSSGFLILLHSLRFWRLEGPFRGLFWEFCCWSFLLFGRIDFARLITILWPLIILLLRSWTLLFASCVLANLTKPYFGLEASRFPFGM